MIEQQKKLLTGFLLTDIIMYGKQNQLHCYQWTGRCTLRTTHCRADVTIQMKYSVMNTAGPTGFGYSQFILGEVGARATQALSLFLPSRHTWQHTHTKEPIHFQWGTLINNLDLTSFILLESLRTRDREGLKEIWNCFSSTESTAYWGWHKKGKTGEIKQPKGSESIRNYHLENKRGLEGEHTLWVSVVSETKKDISLNW